MGNVGRYIELALRLLPLVLELVRQIEALLPAPKIGPLKRALITEAVQAAYQARPELASRREEYRIQMIP